MRLKNKTVVIVGGSRGIGKALAVRFKNEGANVVIASRTKANLEKTAHEINAIFKVVDVRNELELKELAKYTIDAFGSIDIWTNSAVSF